ncbi:MAG: peptide chain release factor 2 [Patescibacteria group bacterium]|jgi:peptide chain release factor 2
MENLLKQLEELREKIAQTAGILDIEKKKVEARELKMETGKPGFWNDRERAVLAGKRLESLESETREWDELEKEARELEEFAALAEKEAGENVSEKSGKAEKDKVKGAKDKDVKNDRPVDGNGIEEGLAEEVHKKFEELKNKFEALEFMVLFSGKYDRQNAILSIHAGTGGTDAQDWAQILERMYLRFSEKKRWKAEILDTTYGGEAGIKSATLRIKGDWAYGYLRSENGVHRLVRISPFDAEAMRHTSFALIEVIPELPETEDLELKDEDLRVDVFRSSGPGGQSVNTTDSAVRITHLATGLVATCQTERSQHQNRENCLKILKSKLAKLAEDERRAEELKLRGEAQKAEWGKQIRSYVMQPYKMVKDHRTKHETQDVDGVLDGKLEEFMESYLRVARNV